MATLLQTRLGRILVGYIVTRKQLALFRGRHFEDVIILLCVRWYLRYSRTYRDLQEIRAGALLNPRGGGVERGHIDS
jgi:hypothetical protein